MTKVISIVSYKFLPAKMGGQKFIALFNKYFSRHLQLVCVCSKNNTIQEAEGYTALPLLSTSPLRYINLFYFFRIRNILKKYQATHLLIVQPYYGWLAFLLKSFTRVKLIVLSHNIEGLRWRSLGKWWWKILWQYEKFTHRQADYSFFVTGEDMNYAIRAFRLDPAKCIVMTYGIEREAPPAAAEKKIARRNVEVLYGLDSSESILLFNGAFDYKPNREGLYSLLNIVNPLLAATTGFSYKLIICGRNIPEDIAKNSFPNVVIAGFVDDIETYFKAADVFLNPTTEGGGIKTKLVEALGYNCNAVSTMNGAIGVDPGICNGKLKVVANDNWKLFAEKVIGSINERNQMSSAFYDHFYWAYNTRAAAEFIERKSLPREAVSQ